MWRLLEGGDYSSKYGNSNFSQVERFSISVDGSSYRDSIVNGILFYKASLKNFFKEC